MFIYLFSDYVTIRHVTASTMLSGFLPRAKQLNGESYTLYWNLKSSFSCSYVCFSETSESIDRFFNSRDVLLFSSGIRGGIFISVYN